MRNSSEINEHPNHWLILSSSSRLWAVTLFFCVLLCSCGSKEKATVRLFPEQTAWHSWTPSSILTCPLHRLEIFNKRDRCVFGWKLQCLYKICLGEENQVKQNWWFGLVVWSWGQGLVFWLKLDFLIKTWKFLVKKNQNIQYIYI